jgi:hypothetical protein
MKTVPNPPPAREPQKHSRDGRRLAWFSFVKEFLKRAFTPITLAWRRSHRTQFSTATAFVEAVERRPSIERRQQTDSRTR